MPSKTSKKKPAAALPSIPKELIDQMVIGPMDAEAINAASMAFKKALIERALGAELSHHLGYPPGAEKPSEVGNHRNGATGKRDAHAHPIASDDQNWRSNLRDRAPRPPSRGLAHIGWAALCVGFGAVRNDPPGQPGTSGLAARGCADRPRQA